MLSSWKEIAHFFGKGVRTVQRWEKTLNLPIHRPPGAPSNVVLARTSDLEEWMHRGPVARAVAEQSDTAEVSGSFLNKFSKLEAEVDALAETMGVQKAQTDFVGQPEQRIAAMIATVSEVNTRFATGRTARAA